MSTKEAKTKKEPKKPELIEIREVAERIGQTTTWIKRKIDSSDFPLPISVIDRTTLWRREHIEPWIMGQGWPHGAKFRNPRGE